MYVSRFPEAGFGRWSYLVVRPSAEPDGPGATRVGPSRMMPVSGGRSSRRRCASEGRSQTRSFCGLESEENDCDGCAGVVEVRAVMTAHSTTSLPQRRSCCLKLCEGTLMRSSGDESCDYDRLRERELPVVAVSMVSVAQIAKHAHRHTDTRVSVCARECLL